MTVNSVHVYRIDTNGADLNELAYGNDSRPLAGTVPLWGLRPSLAVFPWPISRLILNLSDAGCLASLCSGGLINHTWALSSRGLTPHQDL